MKAISIPGRILTRVIGILELCIAFVVLGAYIYAISKFDLYSFNAETAVFGIYFALTFPTSIVLIFATYQVVSLKYRKLISVVWCVIRTFIVVVAFILLVTATITKALWLIVLLMAIWLVSLAGVSMYVYGLMKTLESKMIGLEMIKMKTDKRSSSDNLHTFTMKDLTTSVIPAFPPKSNQLPEISAS